MYRVGTQNKLNRDAWIKHKIQQIPAGSRILDAGAGELQYSHFCQHLHYVSQDFAQYDGKGDNKGLQTGIWDQTKIDIISDIIAIPEHDSSFDAIMCTEVFEHLPEPIKAIKEFSRLLKPGGHLILSAPFCSLTHMAPYHYYSGYNRYFYEKHLVDSGFEILEIIENGNFFEYIAQELRRLPQVSRDYSKITFSPLDYLAQKWLLFTLERCSRKDRDSKELLNFGFHIYARKKDRL